MKILKAIFFDIDDTLYSTTAFSKKARYNAIDEMIRLGLTIDRDECYEMLCEVINEFSSNDSGHFNKLMCRLSDKAKTGINETLTIAAGVSGYHNTKFVDLHPFPDVAKNMPRIAGLPIKLGVISSGRGIKQAEKLVRLRMESYFNSNIIFITENIGIGKKNKKIFEYACSKANVLPGETIYVGDNPETDIDIAHQAGMITILREGSGKHANDPSAVTPDYSIKDFDALCGILKNDFGQTC